MRSTLAAFFILFLFSFSLESAHAQARLLSTTEVVKEISATNLQEQVANFMKNKEVEAELLKRGVHPEEVVKRLASLSEKEIQNLAEQIKDAKAGGDFGIGGFLGVAAFIFIVLLVTDILGFTKVFTFTRSVR